MVGFRLFLNYFERITNSKDELTSNHVSLSHTDHMLENNGGS